MREGDRKARGTWVVRRLKFFYGTLSGCISFSASVCVLPLFYHVGPFVSSFGHSL
jgi:hypothetical protein